MPSLQEEYIKEEQKNLKNELLRAQEEVKRIQARFERLITQGPLPPVSASCCSRCSLPCFFSGRCACRRCRW